MEGNRKDGRGSCLPVLLGLIAVTASGLFFCEDLIYAGTKVRAAATGPAGGPVPVDANADFDGDNTTDFVVLHRESTFCSEDKDPDPHTSWLINENGTANFKAVQWGCSNHTRVIADFDGDGKDDIAVWQRGPAGQAAFWILESSTGAVRIEPFGQTGDSARVVGDYDGDGIADPAVYRGSAFGNQSYFFFLGSLNNPGRSITYIPWGVTDDRPVRGDFDGDGKMDFCVRRRTGGGGPLAGINLPAFFILLRSSDLGAEWIEWGLGGDVAVPADYDGDGKYDFGVVRGPDDNSPKEWFILERDGGGTGASPIVWGFGNVAFAPGDYDGDGASDPTIYENGVFWILRSSDGQPQAHQWGTAADVPLAAWYLGI